MHGAIWREHNWPLRKHVLSGSQYENLSYDFLRVMQLDSQYTVTFFFFFIFNLSVWFLFLSLKRLSYLYIYLPACLRPRLSKLKYSSWTGVGGCTGTMAESLVLIRKYSGSAAQVIWGCWFRNMGLNQIDISP